MVLWGYATTRVITPMFSHCDNATARSVAPKDHWKGKVCWITGASSGIGQQLALQLGAQGARLILSSRRKEALEAVAAHITATVPAAEVRVLPLDLEQVDFLADKAAAAVECFGRVDVLVNNGGVSTRTTARDSTFGVDQKLIKV
jgi:short-subunit dehydrogenase